MRWLPLLALLACGVPQEKYDAVVSERDTLKSQVEGLEKKLKAADSMRTKLASKRAGSKRADPPKEKVDQWLKEANLTRDSKVKATIKTNLGDIACELWPEAAPLTVSNFVGLAEGTKEWTDPKTSKKVKRPLYDGTVFHRVIKGFMIQGGDPLGTGRGGPGYRFEDEVNNGKAFTEKGQLAMANSGPASNGSQFFITDAAPKWLNGKHTLFGKCDPVVSAKIAQVAVDKKKGDRPIETVTIQNIKIQRL